LAEATLAKVLTVRTIEALKPGADRKELPDGLIRGLFFVLQPSGKASWAVRYRHARTTRKLTLGTYPAIDLKAARELGSRALVRVAEGEDPAAEKQAAKNATRAPADRDLVEKVADSFIERYAKANMRPSSRREIKRILDKEILGAWKGRHLSEVKRADVHELLDDIVDRGAPIMANRTLAALRMMANWAVDRGIIAVSPCVGMKAPSAERGRDRVLTDDELRSVWKASDAIGWPFGPFLQLLILTGQRRNEVAGIRWSEVDLEAKTWTLPAPRVKNDVEHVVPLSAAALTVLASVPRIKGDFVFTMVGVAAVRGFAGAKNRLDALLLAESDKIAIPHWTFHDLRRTFASGAARLGINLPVIEKVLNHKSGSFRGIVGVYQRHDFSGEKRAALEAWGRFVERLVSDAPETNVVTIRGSVS
jgi:integrase